MCLGLANGCTKPKEMPELKPCPFCGCKAEVISLKGITAKYIECTNCKISTEVISDDKILFELWNRRTNNATN